MLNTTITYKKPLKTTDKNYHKLFCWPKKITKLLSSLPDPGKKVTKDLEVGPTKKKYKI